MGVKDELVFLAPSVDDGDRKGAPAGSSLHLSPSHVMTQKVLSSIRHSVCSTELVLVPSCYRAAAIVGAAILRTGSAK